MVGPVVVVARSPLLGGDSWASDLDLLTPVTGDCLGRATAGWLVDVIMFSLSGPVM